MESRLVVLSRGPELYSTRRLVRESEDIGLAVRVIDPLTLTLVVEQDGGKILHGGWPVECDAILPRIGYSITRRGVAVVRQFEQKGVVVVNPSESILNSRDKLVACQMMVNDKVPVPITAHVGAWEDTGRSVNRVGGCPCVVKSTEGTHGSGVFLVRSEQQARQLVYQMLERGMRPLVQEYIQESHGVDMLLSERGPLVLEVNSSPGLEGIEKATGVNVARKVAEFLKENLEISTKEIKNSDNKSINLKK